MILWGWGERVLTFDLTEHEHCQKCEQHRDFALRIKYEYGHFYHLFGWVISKQYQLICPVCSHGWVINAAAAQAQLGHNPIPFHQRSGWIVMLALTVVIGIAAVAYRHAARQFIQIEAASQLGLT